MSATPRTWNDGWRCNECCNGDRCDDSSHHERSKCPHCKGTGNAIWNMHNKEQDFRKLESKLTALESTRDKLVRALERSVIALDDWLHVHADDMCDPVKIMQARERINEYGTLAYIARAQEQNRAAIANAGKEG